MTAPPLVLDTNIVLDLLVFQDPATQALHRALAEGSQRWLATVPMREELARVLGYPQIVPRLAYYQRSAAAVLDAFDRWVQPCAVAPKARLNCSDPDDQKFIDLALSHQATLLSKDRAVLALAKRLAQHGVRTQPHWSPAPVLAASPAGGPPL